MQTLARWHWRQLAFRLLLTMGKKGGGGAIALAMVVGLLMLQSTAFASERADAGRFGSVEISRAAGDSKGTIIVFSDPQKPAAELADARDAIVEAGYTVALVDSAHYLAEVDRTTDACERIDEDLAPLLRQLAVSPKQPGGEVVLVGSGAGGAIAYAALAGAKPPGVSGAIGVRFDPVLLAKVPFCTAGAIERTAKGYRYPPSAQLPGWWRMATETADDPALQPYAGGDKTRFVEMRDYDDLASVVLGILASEARALAPAKVSIDELPLVLLPTETHSQVVAIIYSGDGGWRDLDKEIGRKLQAGGIPVVGVDTLRYFWDRRTPEETAASLRLIIDHFTKAWSAPNVLLIGYSFGADVLPFAVNLLPASERQQIHQISLLSLGTSTDFEVHVSNWVADSARPDDLPIAPQVEKLDPNLLQCFYGVEEKDETACVKLKGAEVIETSGGHHFGGDYDAITRQILDGLVHRGALPAPSGGQPVVAPASSHDGKSS